MPEPDGSRESKPQIPNLLRTKIMPPRVRPGTLRRTALVQHLTAEVSPGQVTLIVAGAGWGKTTLLGLWHAQNRRPDRCAWLSIEDADNDIDRFWSYLLSAVGSVDRQLAADVADLLPAPSPAEIDDLVAAFANGLDGATEPVTLVLDNYDLVRNREIHRSMRLLAEHLPTTLQLVISSRARPPLSIATLRARGQLVDLTVDRLRLSRHEAAELLEGQRGVELTAAELELLYERTEGWVAGLHLAILSLREHPSPRDLISSLAGEDRNIADYLRAEVLDRQPEDLRAFLQQTSILQRLSPALCDAVTGQTNSAELIGRIEQDQLFLVPLDNQRHWYRYHHLFADVLCTDLERDRPGTDEELHHRAAIWHTDNDDPVEAVHHALASGDLDLATAFITRYSLLVCLQGSTELVLGWLHALGTDVCRGDVQLCVARALVAAGGNRTADMTHWAELAEAKLELPGTTEATMSSTREVLALARWSAAYSGGDVATSLRLARQATGRDDDNAPWRSASRTALGWSLYRSGQYRAAQDVLSAAAALADEDGDRRNSMVAYGIQAIIAAANQLPHEVERLAVLAVDGSASPAASVHPDAWCIAFARGWASLSQNDSERAGGYFQRSVDLLGQGSKLVEMAESLTALSMAEHILGAEDSADRHVAEARRLLQECADPGYLLADPRKMERGTVRSPAPEAEARWATLTEAEILIASLVAQGLTNRAIAKQLSLSHHTVDSHLKHAFTKLDLRSRVELTRAFLGHQMGPAS